MTGNPTTPTRAPWRSRRIALGALVAAALLGAGSAWSQASWPTRTVRFVVPSPPGTAPDIVARIVGERLAQKWGQAVVIENRPGAGGIVGFSALKNNEKDDHQFGFAPASALMLSPFLFKSAAVDIVRDFTPVAFIGDSPMIVAVNASSPFNSLKDLLAEARKAPDSVVVASPVLYSLPYLAIFMLQKESGTKLRPVPYPGSAQANTAVMANEAQVVIDGLPAMDALVKGGKLKALATFSDKRMPNQPNLPTVNETFAGFDVVGWFGIVASTGTREAIIERVNHDVNEVIMIPEVREKFATFALFSKPMPPAGFGAFLQRERTRWSAVLREVGAPTVTQ